MHFSMKFKQRNLITVDLQYLQYVYPPELPYGPTKYPTTKKSVLSITTMSTRRNNVRLKVRASFQRFFKKSLSVSFSFSLSLTLSLSPISNRTRSSRPTIFPTVLSSRPTIYPTDLSSRSTIYPTKLSNKISSRPTIYPTDLSSRPTIYPTDLFSRPTIYPTKL